MEPIIDELMKNLITDINAKKETLIKEKIQLLTGEDIDLIKEAKKMFPRIVRIYDSVDQSETYYWNDGSENGIRLITFLPQKFDPSDPFKIKVGFIHD